VDIQRPEPGVVMIMIARRQWKMGGTRYNARGIDDDGNVANQTETELIVILQNSQVFSHV
jgi:inositol-1,4,5-trisphosphate 5-phosphatase